MSYPLQLKDHNLFDAETNHIPHHQEYSLVLIYEQICDVGIHRICCDSGSLTEIMYEHCFSQLPEQIRKRMQQPAGHLTSFVGHFVCLTGILFVPLTLMD